jgi:hypothetical protein
MPGPRVTVGSVEVVCLSDATVDHPWPLPELFPGVADEASEPFRERYPATFGARQVWRSAYDHAAGDARRSHTPGQMTAPIESGGERAAFVADALLHPAQVTGPTGSSSARRSTDSGLHPRSPSAPKAGGSSSATASAAR